MRKIVSKGSVVLFLGLVLTAFNLGSNAGCGTASSVRGAATETDAIAMTQSALNTTALASQGLNSLQGGLVFSGLPGLVSKETAGDACTVSGETVSCSCTLSGSFTMSESSLSFSNCSFSSDSSVSGTMTWSLSGETATVTFSSFTATTSEGNFSMSGTISLSTNTISYNVTGSVDSLEYALTGSLTNNGDGSVDGNLTVTSGSLTVDCVFDNVNISTVTEAQLNTACSVR